MLADPDDTPELCWCGEADPHFDDEVYDRNCGGYGVLYCRCCGDICVCHHHGEAECPGCADCDDGESEWTDTDDEVFDAP